MHSCCQKVLHFLAISPLNYKRQIPHILIEHCLMSCGGVVARYLIEERSRESGDVDGLISGFIEYLMIRWKERQGSSGSRIY